MPRSTEGRTGANTCEICGKPNDDKIFIVISTSQKLAVCMECLNDYGNHEFDRLIEKLRKNAGLPETK